MTTFRSCYPKHIKAVSGVKGLAFHKPRGQAKAGYYRSGGSRGGGIQVRIVVGVGRGSPTIPACLDPRPTYNASILSKCCHSPRHSVLHSHPAVKFPVKSILFSSSWGTNVNQFFSSVENVRSNERINDNVSSKIINDTCGNKSKVMYPLMIIEESNNSDGNIN